MSRLSTLALVLLLLPQGLLDAALAQPAAPSPATLVSKVEAVLLREDFNGTLHTLRERGWSIETLAGTGAGFTLAADEADRTIATTATHAGAYPAGLDARLVAPAFDLRRVPGAPIPEAETPADPLVAETTIAADQTITPVRQNASQAGPVEADVRTDEPTRSGASAGDDETLDAAGGLRLWPPDENLTRDRVRPERFPGHPDLGAAPRTSANASGGPAPEGAAHVRLWVSHSWDFATGDGGFAEVRVRGNDGAWSAWRPLAAIVPPEERASVTGILPTSTAATSTGTLPTGEDAFTGASAGEARSMFDLGGFAGRVVQVAFRVRAASTLPPESPGWSLDAVELRAALGAPDLAVEAFEGLDDASAVALNATFLPRVLVRNWGTTPSANETLRLSAWDENGRPLPGFPASAAVPSIQPGGVAAIPYPQAFSSPMPTERRFEAALVLTESPPRTGAVVDASRLRADAQPANDRLALRLVFSDVDAASLDLTQEPASVLTAAGDEKAFILRARNVGNLVRPGRLALWATPLDAQTGLPTDAAREVAAVDLTLPEAFSTIARGLAGPNETTVPLAWSPATAGAWQVDARWGASASPPLRTYVETSPPPILRDPFAVTPDPASAFDAGSAQRLAEWGFDAWGLADGTPRILGPETPSPTRALAAYPRDEPFQGNLALLAGADRTARDALVPIDLALSDEPAWPGFHAEEEGPVPDGNATVPLHVSYARLLFATEPARCADLATPTGGNLAEPMCEDPSGRVALVNGSSLRNATVHQENLTLRRDRTSLVLDDAAFHAGGSEAGLLYAVVDARVDPGVSLAWSPLVASLGNGEEALLLPAGTLRPYEEDGIRCCVVGPYSAAAVLDALAALAQRAPERIESTRALQRWSAARSLEDLARDAQAGATHALAFEHLGLFSWADGKGLRGVVEIESDTPLPQSLARLVFEAPTKGWQTVVVPIDATRLAAGARVRLTLEGQGEALPPCPYLGLETACDSLAVWRVDELRLLERASASSPWRVMARDDLEDADAPTRWSATAGIHARGWRVEASEARVPHRFHLSTDAFVVDAEANASRALRWGEPSSPRTATREPTWSVARTPFLGVSDLASPRLRFQTRYDFGDEQGGRFPAGGALVALVEHEDGSRRRVLLAPLEGPEEGSAYRGDVDAPAFDPLARALRVEVPRGVTATAFTGRSGVPLGQDAPARWVPVEVDLSDLARDPTIRRVALELHALASGPLKGVGWSVDDLEVSEPGPARDLAVTGLPTLRAGAAVGRDATVPLAANLTNHGVFASRALRLELAVLDAAGRPAYPPQETGQVWTPASVTLPAAALAPGESRAVTFPRPWIPQVYGEHRVVARVFSDGDERPANDLAQRMVPVRDASAAVLRADGPLVRGPAGGARPDEPVSVHVALQNLGTLPLDAQRPVTLVLDVLGSDGRSVLSAPRRLDVARLVGRSVLPGEEVALDVPDAWTPRRSGVHRLVLRLDAPGYDLPAFQVGETFVVEERLPPLTADQFLASGDGWTNATRGDAATLWSYAGPASSGGNLTLAEPIALRTASQARVDLTHRYALEEGFDGGRLEARVDGGEWIPVPPVGGYPGALHAPTKLALAGERDGAAFTGASAGLVTTTFDLADAPHLRERVPLLVGPLDSDTPVGAFLACETWLGPTRRPGETVLYAPGSPPPAEAAPEAALHERRDVLVQEFRIPALATGDLRVSYEEWRALGLSGLLDAPMSDAFVYVEGPLGAAATPKRYDPVTPLATPEDRVRGWTKLDLAFPGLLDTLQGQRARLVVEHRQIAAPAPGNFHVEGGSAAGFSSDLLSPHGGLAVTPPILRVASPTGETILSGDGPLLTGSESRWLAHGEKPGAGDLPALAPIHGDPANGFHNFTSAPSVWSGDASTGWTARPAGRAFPDARLVLPLDLSLAQRGILLTLHDERRLSTLTDADADLTGALSLALVEISEDDGATWARLDPREANTTLGSFTLDGGALASRHAPGGLDPEGDSGFGPDATSLRAAQLGRTTFDLTPWAGKPVLLALHASFSTTAAAQDDEWRIRSLRVDADVLRGGDVDIRLRAAADANGAAPTWDVQDLSIRVVRHAQGIGLRLLGPGDGPLTEGFRTLDLEVVNRGAAGVGPRLLHIRVEDPPERGSRVHEATRPVPALAPGASVRIPVRGADLNWYLGANESSSGVRLRLDPLAGDPLRGDDALNVTVGGPNVRPRSLLVPERLDVLPQAVDLGNASRGPITFRALVRNGGEDPAGLAPSRLRVFDHNGTLVRTLEPARPATARVEPNATLELTWSWRPAATMAKGEYRAVAEVLTATSREPIVATLESRFHLAGPFLTDLAYLEPFGAAAGRSGTRPGWSCVGAEACAREDATHRRSEPVSLALGLPSTSLPTQTRAVLESPPFPVVGFDAARLLLHARHDLPANTRALVQAAPVHEDGTRGPWQDVLTFTGKSARHDEGRAFPEETVDQDVPAGSVAGGFQPCEANLTDLLGPGVVAVALRFDAPRAAEGAPLPFAVDDVSVTPLDAILEPPAPVVLPDAVEKRFHLSVHNRGAVSDAYVFSLQDASSRQALLPAGWTIRLVDPLTGRDLARSADRNATSPLDVPANGTREVLVVVTTHPTGAGAPLRGPVPVPLTLRSILLPDLLRHATLPLHAQGSPRPDLEVLDVTVRGADEPVGRTRNVEVALSNRGLAPAQAPLAVLVHPPLGVLEAPERLAIQPPQLAAGATRVVTLPWTPRHPGVHRIVATWDPDGTLLESDVTDNRGEREADVPPAPFPDLRVTLEVAAEASLGAAHPWRLVVENRGSAPARQVETGLRAGVSALLDPTPHPLGDLDPGARLVLEGVWTPLVPGATLVSATAFARAGVPEGIETLADNAAQAQVHVREESLRIDALPAAPRKDGLLAAFFRIANAGNANETYALAGIVPSGWSAAIEVEDRPASSLTLAPGEAANVSLLVAPARHALAGPSTVRLVAEAQGDGARHEATGIVHVPTRGGLRVAVLDEPTLPTDPAIEVVLVNDGNAPAHVSFEASGLPQGWRLLGTGAHAPPGATVRTRLALDLGDATAPTPARVTLAWRAGNESGSTTGPFSVAAYRRAVLEAEAEAPSGGAGPLRVTLANRGNVPERAVLRFDLPAGARSTLDERVVELAPGETRTLDGQLTIPADLAEEDARLRVRLEGVPANALRVPIALTVADLRLADLQPPPATAKEGEPARLRGSVANPGSTTREGVVVELYVDGRALLSRALGDLPAGAVADFDLPWTPLAGRHTLALVAAASTGAPDATPDDNAQAWTLDVAEAPSLLPAAARSEAPAPAGILVVLVLLGVAAFRRRSP